ncbi:MAG: tryptophan synthase subunit alpha, partial [Verrucomicrobiae bacterium]|nr:tryptophan synthase subunit alpha [Verrucomicrobiae bacterium]
VIYIGAGDPDLDTTSALAEAFGEIGVDVLELGVPFSDPLADGPINQMSAQRGLASGTTPSRVLEAVRKIRKTSQIPIVLYVYYNLMHRRGVERFILEAADAGVDGLLVLDLPPEEGSEYLALMKRGGLCAIHLVAPTTPDERIARIAQTASGFVYCVSREGVTGIRDEVSGHVPRLVAAVRRYTDLPVAVGFGISNPEQARLVALYADAVVVGSAVVKVIAEQTGKPDLVNRVAVFVQSLFKAVRGKEK